MNNVLLASASQCLEQMTPADIMANPSLIALDQCVCYATHWVLCYEYDNFSSRDVKMAVVNKGSIKHIFERERERLNLSGFLGTEDTGVHIVHISCVIITYTLE